MSLLLESLKKAALEKKEREKYSESPAVEVQAPVTPMPTIVELQLEKSEPAIESHEIEKSELVKPEDELEFNIDEVEFVIEPSEQSVLVEPVLTESVLIESAAKDEQTLTPSEIELDKKSDHNSELEKTDAAEISSTEKKTPATGFTPESGKAALALLLEKNRKVAKSNKTRSFYLIGILFVTGLATLGGYYYFLMEDSNSISPANRQMYSQENLLPAEDQPTESLITEDNISQVQTAENNSDTESAVLSDVAVSEKTVPEKIQQDNAVQETNAKIATEKTVIEKTTAQKNIIDISAAQPVKTTTAEKLVISQPIESYIQSQPQVQDAITQQVTAAYNAYQQGNWDQAQTLYHDVLMQNAFNRDALLGAAAVAVRQGKPQEALGYYQQQLERDPQDEYAMSGIMSLSLDGNNTGLMSDIDQRLQEKPGTVHLLFLKGTLLANQQQWVAAQGVFFEAWHYDKHNADLAYNLAVCLDRLNQSKEAIRFYQMALSLKTPSANFAPTSVENRLEKLLESTP